MKIELLAYTQANPALTRESAAGIGDLATIWQGQGTYAENVVEFAGRVCYRSTHRMGTAPDFIVARVREGHEDIIEHIVVTVRVSGSDEPLRWRMLNRHCEVSDLGDGTWIVSGNTRVWLDLFRNGIALEAVSFLKAVTPSIFAEFKEIADWRLEIPNNPLSTISDLESLLPVEDGQMRVSLLGFTQPVLDNPALLLHHGSAIFLFEGISRTCTHQLVRHRLASFSQESQRYVDLNKGEWQAIVPPVIAGNPEAMQVLSDFWQLAEEKYAQLRDLGIRKEDARFLLPNAAETRIVTTMNFAAWSHFLWLRAVDKAAQWEIRAMGQHVLRMLYAIAPQVFQAQWNVYLEKFRNN
ncbi:MAG: FAD-dependent thymidylate synthase [Caldilineaceae bacterium]